MKLLHRIKLLWKLLAEMEEHRTPQALPKPIDREVSRLRLLAQFAGMKGKAEEIEKEWQRIQQDEHNAHFAFQILRGNNESEYLYKKGIAEGIKWCIDHFC